VGNSRRSYPAAKVGMRLRGAGAAWIKYPGTACPWLLRVCGRRGRATEAHDHKGPTGTQTLAPVSVPQRRGLEMYI
jgi:hypothetical protein